MAFGNTPHYHKNMAIKQATLINQEGNKQVVDVGSQNATNLMGQGYALMGATPKVPSQLSSDSLTNPSPVITPVTPSFTDINPYVAGLAPTTQGIESLVGTALAPTPQESKVSPITSKITELTGQYANKPVDYQAELDKYGFQTNVNDLQKLNTQIASTKAEYDKYATGLEGKTASASSIYGRQALTQRQSAVELGGLSSMAQALQGNVQMAQSIADKTIAIKYEPLEQEIANQKYQLDQVYNQLSIDEKKKADAIKITLDERQRLIDEQKTKDDTINKLMVTAAGKGATSDILQQMLKAKNPQEAIIIGRDYLREASSGNLQDLGNGNYYNPNTQTVQTINEIQQSQNLAQGIVTTSTGDAYDIKSYATDPTHETKIQSILNSIGQFKTIQDIDNYIQSKYPNSPVTGQMIANAAGKYGVSWEMMTAIMAQDSSMGTAGKAVRTKNPGNVGNTDSGGTKQFNSWQEGVDAVAENLAWRKTNIKPVIEKKSNIDELAANYLKTGKKINEIEGSTKEETAAIKESYLKQQAGGLTPEAQKIKDEATKKALKTNIEKIDSAINGAGFSAAVGPNKLARGGLSFNLFTGNKDTAAAKINSIVSSEALKALTDAKNQGATFGALSDRELDVLASANTTLNSFALKDKQGKVYGYKNSESNIKAELERLKVASTRLLVANGGDLPGEDGKKPKLEQFLIAFPEKKDEYNSIVSTSPNLTDEDIIQVLTAN